MGLSYNEEVRRVVAALAKRWSGLGGVKALEIWLATLTAAANGHLEIVKNYIFDGVR